MGNFLFYIVNFKKSDMFEKEIRFISDFSLNKLKSFGSFVTFEKLSATELHPAIISYISAELDYMIFRDRKKLLEDSIFDYSGREIADHFNVIAEELKQTKKISYSDIEKLIMQAVSFNINYVVRPKWSLTKLIYNDQDFVSVDELERMLNYLYYFDYVKNVLTAYISKRKVIQLTLTEFDLILNKIDRELFKSNSEELINNALHSIADFFNIGGIDKNRISLQAVEIFLKEKNLMDHLLKLRHAIPDGSRKKYEIDDIKKVLYATAPLKPDSISGYEAAMPAIEEIVSADIVLQDIEIIDTPEETDEAKEQSSYDEIEIIIEEKIKSSSVSDDETDIESMIGDALKDEPETEAIDDQLPIEEEFLNEFMIPDEDNSESAIQEGAVESEESTIAEDVSETSLVEELKELMDEGINSEESSTETEPVNVEKETIVKDEKNEMEKDEDTSEEDELLAFYEQELAAMEEDSSEVLDFEKVLTEETKDSEIVLTDEKEHKELLDDLIEEEQSVDTSADEKSPQIIEDNLEEQTAEPSEPDVTTDEEKEQDEVKEEQTKIAEGDTFAKEDFDLSIFEDEEGDKIVDEIIERLSEVPEEENSKVTETPKIPDEKEFDIESDFGIVDEDDKPIERKIVEEMLEEYFDDDSKKEEKIDTKKMLTDEPDFLDDEKSSATADEKMTEKNGENVFDTDLASSILEGSSFEDDISGMIDEIDDIIEENARTFKIPVKDTEIPENQDIEETPVDNEFDFNEETSIDTPSVEETINEEKIINPIPKAEVPIREKDLFSYLSRKEVKKIVSNVFFSDDEDFVTTIEKISECATYKEATEILKGVFFTYRISPYSKDAVVLTNAVSHFFRQV